MRSTTLPMGTFGLEAVVRYASAHDTSPSAVVRDAVLHYLADRDSGRPSWRVPRFARESDEVPSAGDLPVELDDETWSAVETEAERQGVGVILLLRHAVMYFVAET